MKNAKSCANCQHAARVAGRFECRKEPPKIVDVRPGYSPHDPPQALTAFPLVTADTWCSQFFPEAEAPQLMGAVAPEPGREN